MTSMRVWAEKVHLEHPSVPLRVGDTVDWPLTFFEGSDEPLSDTQEAVAEIGPGREERDQIGHTGVGVTWWSRTLRGKGWRAAWAADRPVEGPVEVTGLFWADLDGDETEGSVRGTIRRMQVAESLYVRGVSGNHERQGPVTLKEIETSPYEFADGRLEHQLRTARANRAQGSGYRPMPPPPDHYRQEFGLLIDLDTTAAL